MMGAIRYVLGQIILFVDWVTRPKRPFCVKTRRTIHRLGLNIETRDAKRNPVHKDELVNGGGQYKVPCLAIQEEGKTRWMYESNDIISYLEQRFSRA